MLFFLLPYSLKDHKLVAKGVKLIPVSLRVMLQSIYVVLNNVRRRAAWNAAAYGRLGIGSAGHYKFFT